MKVYKICLYKVIIMGVKIERTSDKPLNFDKESNEITIFRINM